MAERRVSRPAAASDRGRSAASRAALIRRATGERPWRAARAMLPARLRRARRAARSCVSPGRYALPEQNGAREADVRGGVLSHLSRRGARARRAVRRRQSTSQSLERRVAARPQASFCTARPAAGGPDRRSTARVCRCAGPRGHLPLARGAGRGRLGPSAGLRRRGGPDARRQESAQAGPPACERRRPGSTTRRRRSLRVRRCALCSWTRQSSTCRSRSRPRAVLGTGATGARRPGRPRRRIALEADSFAPRDAPCVAGQLAGGTPTLVRAEWTVCVASEHVLGAPAGPVVRDVGVPNRDHAPAGTAATGERTAAARGRKCDGGRSGGAGSLDPRPREVHGVVADVVPVPAHPARGPGGRGGPEPPAAGPRRVHPARRPRHLLLAAAGLPRATATSSASSARRWTRMGAQEVHFPALLPREPYEATGRWTEYGDNLFRLKDRKGNDYLLGPTHEEMFTLLVKDLYSSYKDLPLSIYQIQTKYRDEARPRAGILRGREFVMKDSYSFDVDDAGLERCYQQHRDAYIRIFDRLGLDYVIVAAMSGAMGGSTSEEFLRPPRSARTRSSAARTATTPPTSRPSSRPCRPRRTATASPPRTSRTPPTRPTIETLVGPRERPPAPRGRPRLDGGGHAEERRRHRCVTRTATASRSSSACPATARSTSSASRRQCRPAEVEPFTEPTSPRTRPGQGLHRARRAGREATPASATCSTPGSSTGTALDHRRQRAGPACVRPRRRPRLHRRRHHRGRRGPRRRPVPGLRGRPRDAPAASRSATSSSSAASTPRPWASGARRERQARHGHHGLLRDRRLPRRRRDRRGDPRRARPVLAARGGPGRRPRRRDGQGRRGVRRGRTGSARSSRRPASGCSTTTGPRCRPG